MDGGFDHRVAAVALILHHDQFAFWPAVVQLPGGGERTAHVEAAVDQDRRQVGDAMHAVEQRRGEGRVLPIVDDERGEDLAEDGVVITGVVRVSGIERNVRILPGAPCPSGFLA
jgi:hypothetical protein